MVRPPVYAPSSLGCPLSGQGAGWWVHLRRCAGCGHIGCCDSSPGQHATAHWRCTGHSVITSFEPGEDWYFDYRTEETTDGPDLAPPAAHPADQPAPGPRGKVPADWQDQLN